MGRNFVHPSIFLSPPLTCPQTLLAGPQTLLAGPRTPLAGPQTPLAGPQTPLVALRPHQLALRPLQLVQTPWMDGRLMDGRIDGQMKFLPILQDFVPYQGRCPATL